MEPQAFLNIVIGIAGMLGGFILRATWTALEAMRKDLAALQESISTNYVRRDDFREHAHDIKQLLVCIEAKLDGKVDKS